MKKALLTALIGMSALAGYAQNATYDNVTINSTFTKSGGAGSIFGWGEANNNTFDPRPNWRPDALTYMINHHTGLTLSAHSVYGGIRFYNQGYPSVYDPANGARLVMSITNNNVGIGTSSPTTALDVRGIISTPEIAFRNADGSDDSDPYRLRKVRSSANQNWLELQLNDDADESFRIYGNSCAGFGCGDYSQNLYHSFDALGNVYHRGNVGIGTATPDAKLAVNGTIHTREVRVDTQNFPDFVFKPSYSLPSLKEVKNYIDQKGHLPGMPSEAEAIKEGMNLGEMNKKLLQKVEELTLYLIEKDKQINRMSKRLTNLENKRSTSKK